MRLAVRYSFVFTVAALAALFASTSAWSTEYRAGTGTFVKTFGTRSQDDVKSLATPKMVYFYDADPFRNNFAEKLDAKDFLGNEDVQAVVKKFTKIKVAYDGAAPKGWPQDLRVHAKSGAAILLMSSDNQKLIWFDRDTPHDTLNAEGFTSAVHAIEDYDKSHKPEKDKDKDKDKVAAKKDDVPAGNDALKIKGLPVANDDNNNTKKPAPAPTPDPPKKPTSGPKDE